MPVNMGTAIAYLELDTKNFTKGFSSALQDLKVFSSSTATTEQKLKGLQSSFSKTGSLLSRSVTLPIAGVGAAALKTSMDFESGMSSVQAISGATGSELEALRKTAIDLGASTTFSATEVAGAMTEMAKAGWDNQQIMDGMAGVLDAAAASGEELSTVSTIVADAITSFGLAASDSTHVADLLTQSANAGTISISDLGESFKYIAPVAKTMGFSIEDTTTAITALSTAGIKGSQAGTALRTMFARLAKPTDQVAEAMDVLGIKLTDNEGNFKSMDTILREMRRTFQTLTPEQQAYYSTLLAGQEGMSALNALLGMSQEEYDKIAESMKNADGIAKETAETMTDNLKGAVEQLGGSLESAAIIIGDKLTPYIRSLAEWIDRLIGRFNNLDPETQDFIVKMGLIAGAAGPVLLIFSKVIGIIATLGRAFGIVSTFFLPVTKAFTMLKGGISASTLMMAGFSDTVIKVAGILTKVFSPVTVVIGILVGAFTTLWKTSEEFRNQITTIFNDIKGSFSNFFDEVVNKINELGFDFSSVAEIIHSVWNELCQWLAPVFVGAFKTVSIALDSVLQSILGVLDIFIGFFTGDFEQMFNGVKEILDSVLTLFANLGSNILSTIGEIGSRILETLGLEKLAEGFQMVFQTLADFVGNIPNMISGAIQIIVNFFTVTIPEAFNSAVTAIGNFFNNIIEFFTVTIPEAFNNFVTVTIPNFINSVETFFSELPYKIGYALGQVLGQIILWGQNMITWVTTNVPLIIENIVTFFAELPGKIWNFLVMVITNVINWGIQMVQNGITAANNFITNVINFIQQLPGRVWTWLTTTVRRVQSWAVEMISAGVKMATDFVNNIINFIRDLPNKVYNIVKQIPGKVKQVGTSLYNAGREIFTKLWDGIKSIGDSIIGWVGDFASTIGDFVSGIVDGFMDIVSGSDKAKNAARSVKGSHANGLDYVPYNGYIAELHEGERVLTKQEAKAYNEGRNNQGGDTFNFYNTKPDPYEYSRQMKRAKRELLYGI